MKLLSANAPTANKSKKLQAVRRKPSEVYDYRDKAGHLLFQVCRYVPKTFSHRRPAKGGGWIPDTKGIEKVLFRLPETIRDARHGLPIFVCEGEKDVLAMVAHKFPATCNPCGAGYWQDSFSQVLRGADVVIIADKDDSGRKHGQSVATKLHGVAKTVRVIELPDIGGETVNDSFDFFAAGGTATDIRKLVAKAPVWKYQNFGGDSSDSDSPPKTIRLPKSRQFADAIQQAIDSCLPEKPRQNHRRLFDLAREIKAIEKSNSNPFTPIELKSICRAWCDRSRKFLRHDFDHYFFKFLDGLERVRYPAGERVLTGAWERAQKISGLPEWELLESEDHKTLCALCRELQICAGDHSFILPARIVRSLFKLKRPMTAWRWLDGLCLLKILKKVKAGSSAKREPNEYRYLPAISVQEPEPETTTIEL